MMATVDTTKLRENASRDVTSQVKIYIPTDQSR
jgi:hypothetical protein